MILLNSVKIYVSHGYGISNGKNWFEYIKMDKILDMEKISCYTIHALGKNWYQNQQMFIFFLKIIP